MTLGVSGFFAAANYVEAALWALTATGLLVHALVRPRTRSAIVVAAITLIAFALSDVIEVRTGAWWRPWWLLAWKGGCVLVLLALLRRYVIARHIADAEVLEQRRGAGDRQPAAEKRVRSCPSPGTPGEGWGEGDVERRESLDEPKSPSS